MYSKSVTLHQPSPRKDLNYLNFWHTLFQLGPFVSLELTPFINVSATFSTFRFIPSHSIESSYLPGDPLHYVDPGSRSQWCPSDLRFWLDTSSSTSVSPVSTTFDWLCFSFSTKERKETGHERTVTEGYQFVSTFIRTLCLYRPQLETVISCLPVLV